MEAVMERNVSGNKDGKKGGIERNKMGEIERGK